MSYSVTGMTEYSRGLGTRLVRSDSKPEASSTLSREDTAMLTALVEAIMADTCIPLKALHNILCNIAVLRLTGKDLIVHTRAC